MGFDVTEVQKVLKGVDYPRTAARSPSTRAATARTTSSWTPCAT